MTTGTTEENKPVKGIKVNQEVYIFLVCLFIAALWWFLNAFSKDGYNAIITYPLRYEIHREGEVISNELRKDASVKIKGHGFALMSQELFGGKDTLVITSEMLTIKRIGDRTKGYVTPVALHQQFERQLPSDVHLTQILTDSIYFDFDRKVSRLIPVVAVAEIGIAPGYSLDRPVVVNPSTIKVSGPKRVLDTLRVLVTEPIVLNELEASMVKTVPLKAIQVSNIIFNQKEVELDVSVALLTEKSFKVPVVALGVPDSIAVTLFPQIAEVKVMLPMSLYNEANLENFRLVVKYEDMVKPGAKRLKVYGSGGDEYIRLQAVKPEKVEFRMLAQ